MSSEVLLKNVYASLFLSVIMLKHAGPALNSEPLSSAQSLSADIHHKKKTPSHHLVNAAASFYKHKDMNHTVR